MFKKIAMAATLMTATLSGQTLAQENINPWKHCGIGAIIFDDNGTAAAISNVIWEQPPCLQKYHLLILAKVNW